ncbi:MAG: 3TM-type holin [Magnetovibrionaceae bacterium]
MISAALSLAAFAAPKLVNWIAGDKAGKVAEEVIGIAQKVTGTGTPEDALQALKDNPEALVAFQQASTELEVRLAEEETKRLQTVNETMRSENKADDAYVRRWRPTWGYVTAGAWAVQALGVFGCLCAAAYLAVIGKAADASTLLIAAGDLAQGLTIQWGVALTVLGVSVTSRSRDKQTAVGLRPPAMLEQLGGLIGRSPSPKEPTP